MLRLKIHTCYVYTVECESNTDSVKLRLGPGLTLAFLKFNQVSLNLNKNMNGEMHKKLKFQIEFHY